MVYIPIIVLNAFVDQIVHQIISWGNGEYKDNYYKNPRSSRCQVLKLALIEWRTYIQDNGEKYVPALDCLGIILM